MLKKVRFKFYKRTQIFDMPDMVTKATCLEVFFENEMKKTECNINVVIAIPYYDSVMSVIKDKHDGLFQRQYLKKAQLIADTLKEKRINVVNIISDAEYTHEAVENADMIDYVIFLDVFTELERKYIGLEVEANTRFGKINKKLHAIELYSVSRQGYRDHLAFLVNHLEMLKKEDENEDGKSA